MKPQTREPPEPPPPDARPPVAGAVPAALACAGVFAITALVFSEILHNDFVSCDSDLVEFLRSPMRDAGWRLLPWAFTSFWALTYNPLAILADAALYRLVGTGPAGFHAAEIALHAANAALLCLLFTRLLERAGNPEPPGRAAPASAAAALLFALNPVNVFSVASAAALGDILCALFVLVSVLCYLEAHPAGLPVRPRWRDASLLCAFAAALSRWCGVCLPVVLAVLDVYPLRRLPGDPRRWAEPASRRVWLQKLPYAFLSAFTIIVYAAAKHVAGPGRSARLDPILTAFGLAFELGKILRPVGLRTVYVLSGRFNAVAGSRPLGAAAMAAVTWVLLAARRRWPAAPAGWICFIAALLPPFLLVRDGWLLVGDRYVYVPSMALCVVAAAATASAARRLAARAPAAGWLPAAAVLSLGLFLAGRARAEMRFWRDDIALWSRVLALEPDSMIAHDSIAVPLMRRGRVAEAMSHFKEALRINPESAGTHYNYGVALLQQGRRDDAAAEFRESLRLDPRSPDAREALAFAANLESSASRRDPTPDRAGAGRRRPAAAPRTSSDPAAGKRRR